MDIEAVRPRIANWQLGDGRQTLALGHGPWQVAITSERRDTIGCLIWEIGFKANAAGAIESVEAWALRLCQRVTSLGERLQVIELEQGPSPQALLRSAARVEGDESSYYEMRLEGIVRASLIKYRTGTNTGKRGQVTFALTNDALARLVDELAG
jgi:hypothetical protein